MLAGAVLGAVLAGLATVPVPPSQMLEQNDHPGLALGTNKKRLISAHGLKK